MTTNNITDLGELVKTGKPFSTEVKKAKRFASQVLDIAVRNELLNHFRKYRGDSMFSDILYEDNEATFTREVLGFYDLSKKGERGTILWRPTGFALDQIFVALKNHSYPEHLIDLIDPFGEESSNKKRLYWEVARSEFANNLEKFDKNNYLCTAGIGLGLTNSSIAVYLSHSLLLANPLVVPAYLCLGGIVGLSSMFSYEGTKDFLESTELGKLYLKAERADSFLDQHRDRLIQEFAINLPINPAKKRAKSLQEKVEDVKYFGEDHPIYNKLDVRGKR